MLRKLGKYLYHIIIIAFLAAALWQAFAPFILHGDEVRKVRKDAVRLAPGKVATMLANPAEKPTLLFVYASWCAACKDMGHVLLAMSAAGELDEFYTLFLSLDTEEADFARYFVMNGYHAKFYPYMLDAKAKGSLDDVLVLAGSRSYGVGIPYLGVFSGQGKMLQEVVGSVDENTVRAMMAATRRTPASLPAL